MKSRRLKRLRRGERITLHVWDMLGIEHCIRARAVRISPTHVEWRESFRAGRRSEAVLLRNGGSWVRGWDTIEALELRARVALLA